MRAVHNGDHGEGEGEGQQGYPALGEVVRADSGEEGLEERHNVLLGGFVEAERAERHCEGAERGGDALRLHHTLDTVEGVLEEVGEYNRGG